MGNGVAKLNGCCAVTAGDISRRYEPVLVHDGLGHSFCYVPTRSSPTEVRPDPIAAPTSIKTTNFRSISGASVSANPSTALSTAAAAVAAESFPYNSSASAFESSDCFASLPLQPVPRGTGFQSFPVNPTGSGSIERGFLSGPIERGFLSGPMDRGLYSGLIDKKAKEKAKRRRSFSHSRSNSKTKSKKKLCSFKSVFMNLILSKISRSKKSMIEPINGSDSINESDTEGKNENITVGDKTCPDLSSHASQSTDEKGNEAEEACEFSMQSQNLQWAQGKAGEDRVHIVVSEENGWVFVGIYDGFNGPDAPEYLLNNLYHAVHEELKGLLWNDKFEPSEVSSDPDEHLSSFGENGETQMGKKGFDRFEPGFDKDNCPATNREIDSFGGREQGKSLRNMRKVRWRCEWDREKLEFERKLKERLNDNNFANDDGCSINHTDVLRALSQALKKSEEAYLEISDKVVAENPELGLMGSCVLVMLMKGEDVYLMSVGDSRAVLAQKVDPNINRLGRKTKQLEMIKEESSLDVEETNDEMLFGGLPSLFPLQLIMEHSTRVEEEVRRIRKEHPDDASAVENERVKGYLKVTRAFGAGFLKQPKWNDSLLEMFRINYVGTSPYITCSPSLRHHRITSRDKFLILSSDGLYEYFSNQEVVLEVESFITAFPEGDPAQHLIEEVLFRAAKKFGMDFHELLEIPQGYRRRYHDDVSVIVISLEGRIWRSSM